MTSNIVLLVTASYDLAAEYVGRTLSNRGVPTFRLDTDRFPSVVRIRFSPEGGVVFTDGENTVSGGQIKSVWYRRDVSPDLPAELDAGTRDFCERETRAFVDGALEALPTKRWLSSPQAIRKAERKPYQLAVASSLGFRVPHTVITNDEIAVRELGKEHHLVAKAVSSGYIGSTEGNRAIFTSALAPQDLQDLGGLAMAPVIFQELIDKISDIRVTVVGRDVFAAEILSQERESSRIDWRATDDPSLKHRRHNLPTEVSALCRALVSRLGLFFGAIDLAITKNGEYIYFEINPNGEWLWLEDQLGFPISEKIAEWLD